VLYQSCRTLALGILRLVFRIRATGLENVPGEGPAILASNHISLFDPPVVGAPIRRPIHFMAKTELFRIPGFGALIRGLNAHPVDRSGSDAAALRLALRILGDGGVLLLFPEGTRGDGRTLQRAQAGTGMLAALSGAPVVPVYVTGTGQVLPKGAVMPRVARISVAYGPPLAFGRAKGKGRYQTISDEIMAAIGRLRDGHRQEAVASTVSLSMARTVPERLSAGRIH
jgi:1-acyl-sn-glycerol-3-phosphate acyltransferase